MILAAYHAAHASALWCLLVPGMIGALVVPPAVMRLRGWGDSAE